MYKDMLVVPNSLHKIAEFCVLCVLTTNLNRASPRIVHMQAAYDNAQLQTFNASTTILKR